MVVDPKLKDWASEAVQEWIDVANDLGSIRAAERKLGLNNDVAGAAIRRLRDRAAKKGYAPGSFTSGVAPGFVMGKVTVQRGPAGEVERTWERQSPDEQAQMAMLEEAAKAMASEIPRVDPIEKPTNCRVDLANLYVFTDYHFGAMAWREEGGADWDLKIAETLILKVMEQMVAQSPSARVGVLAQLGDLLHADGLLPVTPTSGHVLDADGRFSKVVQVAIRCLRRLIDMMLMKHEEVHVIMGEGNHDIASSVWLRVMFQALYENEPRVTVNASELPYYVYQHGETMLGFHHGHIRKREQLPILFAAQYPKMWGNTTKRYIHCGHQHHERMQEHSGVKVIQHPTLAARDAHASRGGWISERQASCTSYHTRHGKVGEVVITPEMVT